MPSKVDQNAIRRRGVGLIASDPDKVSPGYVLFSPLTTNKVCIIFFKPNNLTNITLSLKDLPNRHTRKRNLSMVYAFS